MGSLFSLCYPERTDISTERKNNVEVCDKNRNNTVNDENKTVLLKAGTIEKRKFGTVFTPKGKKKIRRDLFS